MYKCVSCNFLYNWSEDYPMEKKVTEIFIHTQTHISNITYSENNMSNIPDNIPNTNSETPIQNNS